MDRLAIAQGANKRFFHELQTTADPAGIWELWTTPSSWKAWDLGLADAEFDGPFVVGAVGRIVPKSGPKARFRVIALDPEQSYAIRTALPLAGLVVARSFVGQSPTIIRHDVHFERLLGGFWAGLLGPGFRKALPLTMDALVKLAAGRPEQ